MEGKLNTSKEAKDGFSVLLERSIEPLEAERSIENRVEFIKERNRYLVQSDIKEDDKDVYYSAEALKEFLAQHETDDYHKFMIGYLINKLNEREEEDAE